MATGRFPEYADKFKDRFKVNAPIVALNGAVLYDKDNEQIIEKWPMAKEDCYKLVKYVNDNWTKFGNIGLIIQLTTARNLNHLKVLLEMEVLRSCLIVLETKFLRFYLFRMKKLRLQCKKT